MSSTHIDAIKIARERLNNAIQQHFDRNLFIMLGAAPITSEEMEQSLVRSEWYGKQYRRWWFRMEAKYGTGQGGGLNWQDRFNPEDE